MSRGMSGEDGTLVWYLMARTHLHAQMLCSQMRFCMPSCCVLHDPIMSQMLQGPANSSSSSSSSSSRAVPAGRGRTAPPCPAFRFPHHPGLLWTCREPTAMTPPAGSVPGAPGPSRAAIPLLSAPRWCPAGLAPLLDLLPWTSHTCSACNMRF